MSDMPASFDTGDRLAKVIARSGLCSRRDAEGWIVGGRVVVNGKTVLTPAFNVTDRDVVLVDGAPLAARQGTRVWLYHKPAGLVVTEKDPEGRETIFEHLQTHGLPRVVTVGRLDINTEGLLLLTNDGGLKRVLELPATGWLRRYRVRAHGAVTQAALDRLKDGIEIDGIKYGSIEATLEREQGTNVWLVVALREGKNREVKNVLGALGLEVNRLIRVSYGPFQLGDIPLGGVETVRARILRDQLGKKLAEAADVDFDSEMPEINQLVGKPMRDRRSGRGTNTVEIGRQRFRFTDHAEKSAAELRAERPRQDRPGRFNGQRSRVNAAVSQDICVSPPRRIHFDDAGRASEDYVERRHMHVDRRRDKGAAAVSGFEHSSKRSDRKPIRHKLAEDRVFGKKSSGEKVFKRNVSGNKLRRDDDGDRSSGGQNKQSWRDSHGVPIEAERPARGFVPRIRPESERGEGALFKGKIGQRPDRNFLDKPRKNSRPTGGRDGSDKLRGRSEGKAFSGRDGKVSQRATRPGKRPPGGPRRPRS